MAWCASCGMTDCSTTARLHEYLAHWIYRDQTVWDYIERPAYAALGAFVLLLFFALPKDRERWLVLKHGRRLRGRSW